MLGRMDFEDPRSRIKGTDSSTSLEKSGSETRNLETNTTFVYDSVMIDKVLSFQCRMVGKRRSGNNYANAIIVLGAIIVLNSTGSLRNMDKLKKNHI